jgi:hypothetical protein
MGFVPWLYWAAWLLKIFCDHPTSENFLDWTGRHGTKLWSLFEILCNNVIIY